VQAAEKDAAMNGGSPGIFHEVGRVKMAPSVELFNGHAERKAAVLDKRIKRTEETLNSLKAQIVAFLAANPDSGAETVAKALTLTVKELALPMRQLVKEKLLFKKGVARSTTYRASSKATTAKKE